MGGKNRQQLLSLTLSMIDCERRLELPLCSVKEEVLLNFGDCLDEMVELPSFFVEEKLLLNFGDWLDEMDDNIMDWLHIENDGA